MHILSILNWLIGVIRIWLDEFNCVNQVAHVQYALTHLFNMHTEQHML